MQPSDSAARPSRTSAGLLIGILFLAFMFSYLDRGIISLLTPALKTDLGLGDVQVSLLQGVAFVSVYALAGLPLGHMVDRANRRLIIVAGVAFWSLATIACGLATTFWQLFAARLSVGLGEACLMPAAVSLVADYFQPHQRGKVMGYVQAGTPIGAALAVALGGLILSLTGPGGALSHLLPAGMAPWQSVFVAVGAPSLLIAALALAITEPARRQVAPAAMVPGETASLLRVLKATPLVFFLFFATFGGLFVVGYGTNIWGPTILMRVYDVSPARTGAVFGLMLLISSPMAAVVGGFLSDAMTRRRPHDGRMLIPALLTPAVILSLWGFSTAEGMTPIIIWLGITLFFTNLICTTSFAAIQDLTPNRVRGKVVALHLLIANVAGLGAAPLLIALVTDHVFADEMRIQAAVGLVSICAATWSLVMALLLVLKLHRTRPAAALATPAVAA